MSKPTAPEPVKMVKWTPEEMEILREIAYKCETDPVFREDFMKQITDAVIEKLASNKKFLSTLSRSIPA